MLRWMVKVLLHGGVFLAVSHVVPGFTVVHFKAALTASLVFAFCNAFIKPIITLLSLPVTLMTLGLFSLVINAGIMALCAYWVEGFMLSGFMAALWGWLAVTLGGTCVDALLKKG